MKILHVVATDGTRGAETFAADLSRQLELSGMDQRTAVLTHGTGAMREQFRSFRPDIVLAHGGQPLKHCAFQVGRTPLIYRRIGMAPPQLRSGVRRRLYARLMRRASRIVAVADAVRRETLTLFSVSGDRVLTVPNGVDPHRLDTSETREEARGKLGLPHAAPVLLSLGALSPEKDPMAHLEVAERVLRAVPSSVHLVVGDGPLRREVERHAAGADVADRIRFLGVRHDVGTLLSSSDVLIFASRPDGMEGMPAVLIEAGMSKVPVVGFDIAGAAEVVVDGVTGSLIPWRDIGGLTDSVVSILERRDLQLSMGAAARERCLERFSISTIAARYFKLIREVCR